jgi:hypothetical protein
MRSDHIGANLCVLHGAWVSPAVSRMWPGRATPDSQLAGSRIALEIWAPTFVTRPSQRNARHPARGDLGLHQAQGYLIKGDRATDAGAIGRGEVDRRRGSFDEAHTLQ